MVICESLKDKVIVIAESDKELAKNIRLFLEVQGFVNIKMAREGANIYEVLRPFYDLPEQIGLIVINENLPRTQVSELLKVLSCDDNMSAIPFVILGGDNKKQLKCDIGACQSNKGCINHHFSLPINYAELLIVVTFQLKIKHERFLRYKQEERLINELAERKVVDAKLKFLVVHDELTSLLNRQNFERQLRLILNRSKMLQQNGVLLFIDIDHFSLVNELEGFEIGDRILVDVVSIIRKLANKNDLFARIGSDEFCLYITNKNIEIVKQFAEKVRQAIYDHRFFIGDTSCNASISIGLSSLKSSSAVYHPSELISRAKLACNMAKENGRNLVWEYNENDSKVKERLNDIVWVPLIKKALLEDDFFLVFQPVVDLTEGIVSHYEVLIRMRDNDKVIFPNDFIPVAERMGLIHSIDHWVVENAIDFLAQLPSNFNDVSLAINLSSVAFQDESLLPVIKDKLELTWIDSKRLTFEITETAAVDSFEQTRDMIGKIRALGCKFALDDFGAGFCSFNYLKMFPVDYVKIDGQFIQNLLKSETDQVLVRSMTEIATKLGKKTIAEFVESPETVVKLREMGVNLGQGYLFGKPEKELLFNNTVFSLDVITSQKDIGTQLLEKTNRK